MRDLYQIVGVEPSASQADIRRAFHKLAHRLHPDRLKPNEYHKRDRFKAVTAAVSILSDPVKRQRYDLGHIDNHGHAHSSPKYKKSAKVSKGRLKGDAAIPKHSLTISFLEAMKGTSVDLKLGKIKHKLTIPPGLRGGHVFALSAFNRFKRVRHRALLTVNIAKHAHFARRNNDILLSVPVAPYEAVLGAKIEVPTIWGKSYLLIPENAKDGQVIRLKGQGIKLPSGQQGDQLVLLKVTMPKDDMNGLKTMMEKWRLLAPYNPRLPWLRSFSS